MRSKSNPLILEQTIRELLIDDMRNRDVDRIARTYDDGILALEKEGPWDVLYLDHDLGCFSEGKEYTGYDVLCWIEAFPEFAPKKIELVTSNPAVRIKMLQTIEKIYERARSLQSDG